MSSSNSTYRVIKPPVSGAEVTADFFLGRSQKGIYYALLDDDCRARLRVWILEESCDQTEWKLRQDTDLGLALRSVSCDRGSWVFENDSSDDESEGEDEEQVEEEFEWNSDDDNIPPTNDMEGKHDAFTQILGFRPYKEIIFFYRTSRGLAYHLSSSKLEALGNLLPIKLHYMQMHVYVRSSVPYALLDSRIIASNF